MSLLSVLVAVIARAAAAPQTGSAPPPMPPTPQRDAAFIRALPRCVLPLASSVTNAPDPQRAITDLDLSAAAMRRDALRFPLTACDKGKEQ